MFLCLTYFTYLVTNVLQDHQHCNKWQDFIFYGLIIIHCLHIPLFSLCIHLSIDTYIVFISWLMWIMWIMLQGTWEPKHLFRILISFFLLFLYIYLVAGLLDHMVVLFLSFWGISIPFSIMDVPIYIPTNRYKGSCFFIPLPTLGIYCSIDSSHGNMCEVILLWLWF